MKSLRSYKKLINETINLTTAFQVEIIDYVVYNKIIYPILCFKRLLKTAKKTVVLLSGQHGDETFAVTTLAKWMQQFKTNQIFRRKNTFEDLNIYIYPIVNPFGYEHGCRDNGAKQDTNNDESFYKDSPVKELSILYDHFPSNINIIIDIHGDTSKRECYYYEHKIPQLPSIATKTALEMNHILPYLKQKTIYGCTLTNGVLIPPKCDIGIEGAIEKLGVDYTITLELPGIYDGQKRVEGGINIINSLLYNFMEIK